MDSVKTSLARELFKEKKYPQALVVSNDIIAVDPSNLEALWIQSTCYFELGDDQSAEKNLRFYLQHDPSNAESISKLAICLKRQERINEAVAYLQAQIESLQSPILYSELADLYLEQGNSDLAISNANQALSLDPDNFKAQMVMGSVFILLGAPKEALKYLYAARETGSSNPQVYINLSAAYGLLGQTVEQIESLRLALMCDSSLHGLHLMIGELYLNQNQAEAAVQTFLRYLSIDPEHVDANFGLAQAYQMSGQDELAKKHYFDVVRAQPENTSAWIQLAQLFESIGETEKAIKCFKQVLELDPDNHRAKAFITQ